MSYQELKEHVIADLVAMFTSDNATFYRWYEEVNGERHPSDEYE